MKQQSRRKAASKPRAIQTSRHFRMSHRRHSGHVLPRRSTSYPVLLMIVLCTGVFLSSWTHIVAASQSYDVEASVPGIVPTQAATITAPTSGANLTSKPITVIGTCPKDTYVKLMRNNLSSGIALCSSNGDYSLTTDLSEGVNVLVAKVYSLTDLPGPDSNSVTVNYAPKAVGDDLGSAPSVSNKSSFRLTTDYKFKAYNIGDLATWQIQISGGTSPYAISVDWGDGHHDLYSRASSGDMTLEHRYKEASDPINGFVVKVSATDNSGVSTYLQLVTVVHDPSPASGVNSLTRIGGISGPIVTLSSGQLGNLIKYAWPGYGIVLLMLVSFWLGELREVHLLKLHPQKIRHKHS